MVQALQLNVCDNVATLMSEAVTEESISVFDIYGAPITTLAAKEKIPLGHKVAVTVISAQSTVIKYGESIGRTKSEVQQGQWVHTHNVESMRGRGDLDG